MLQAYATQHYLDIVGIPNETINISALLDFKKGKKKYYKRQLFNFKFYRAKLGMIKLLLRKRVSKKLKNKFQQRDRAFSEFERMHFRLTPAMQTYQQLNEYCGRWAQNVLVGSDQLWLPVNVVADYYTLNFVPSHINKVAYATSFGVAKIPKNLKSKYHDFLSRVDHISVREESGRKLVNELAGRDCSVVCDPTMLLERNEWDSLTQQNPSITGKYIFCYFLGKEKSHRKFAEELKRRTGYKIVSINHCDEYVKYSDRFADEAPFNVGPSEWLNMIRHAEYVCTDSFHGTVFSLIYNKTFFSFRRFKKNSTFSTNSRLDTLLGQVGLINRILCGTESGEQVDRLLQEKIDFELVNQRLQNYRDTSKRFLREALSTESDPYVSPYITIENKIDCCGCSACANSCPANCIAMEEDAEGFRYPVVDETKCLKCGLCKRVCPITNRVKECRIDQSAYLVRHKNEQVLRESTSGGVFTALAQVVIENGGVVFGAALNEQLDVQHIFVQTEEDLYKFRNSKYVQSTIGDCFQQAKEFLDSGRQVLFSGTPCQIEGVKRFLRKDYENLFTVDVVCRACPSPLIWRKYRAFRSQDGHLTGAKFRDKADYGYDYSQISLTDGEKRQHYGVESDPYLRAFFTNLSDRPSCYACAFKKRYRVSDITIWDCFDVYRFDKKLADNKGVTRVLVHSSKGDALLHKAEKNCQIKKIDAESAVAGVREMVRSVPTNANREQFFADANAMDGGALFSKWFPDTFKIKMERFIRRTTEKLGIYASVKRFAKKILRK